jgi:hypothetical protein
LEKLYLTSRDIIMLDRRGEVGAQLTRPIYNAEFSTFLPLSGVSTSSGAIKDPSFSTLNTISALPGGMIWKSPKADC